MELLDTVVGTALQSGYDARSYVDFNTKKQF